MHFSLLSISSAIFHCLLYNNLYIIIVVMSTLAENLLNHDAQLTDTIRYFTSYKIFYIILYTKKIV